MVTVYIWNIAGGVPLSVLNWCDRRSHASPGTKNPDTVWLSPFSFKGEQRYRLSWPILLLEGSHMTRVVDWCKNQHLKSWWQLEQAAYPFLLAIYHGWLLKCLCLVSIVLSLRYKWWGGGGGNSSRRSGPVFLEMSPVIGSLNFYPGLADPKYRPFLTIHHFRLHSFLNDDRWNPCQNSKWWLIPLPSWQAMQLGHYLCTIKPTTFKLQPPTECDLL